MRSSRLHSFLTRRLAWLLAFALLLPMAQAAAHWHLLSHAGAQHSEHSDEPHAIHKNACDLCLSAVTLTGGAMPGSFVSVVPTLAPAERIVTQRNAVWFARPQRPYQSRAPPIARI